MKRVRIRTFPQAFYHRPRRRAWKSRETTPLHTRTSRSPPSRTRTRARQGGGGGRKGVTIKTSLLGAAGSPQQFASRLASHHLLPGGEELIRSLPAPHSLSLALCHTRTVYYCSHTPSHARTRTYNARCAAPPAHERCFGPAQQVDRSAPRSCKHGSRGTFSPSCEPNRTEPNPHPWLCFHPPPGCCFFFFLEGHLADGKSVGRTQLRTGAAEMCVEENHAANR